MRRQDDDAELRWPPEQPAPAALAQASVPAGLAYVSDAMPGIRRVRRGRGFAYRDSAGRWLRDGGEIQRIRRLAVPPAYADVWICPLANGHLQATGRDVRGRKQYRYHPRWREHRDDGKFGRLPAFGRALPRIRARVARDLAAGDGAAPSRDAVLAALVRLLDATCFRVGNDEYTQSNGSYGLTTLRNRHAGVRGSVLRLAFRGKSGVAHDVSIDDRRVARIVRRCQDLPGQELFCWVAPDGSVRSVGSADVNDYLHAAAGFRVRFTAKDFRTWHATVHALELIHRAGREPAGKALATQVIAAVAARLRNTAAVCRKSYIHPAVLELARAGPSPIELAPRRWAGLRAGERRLLAFLDSIERG